MPSGKVFQKVEAVTGKERRPTVDCCYQLNEFSPTCISHSSVPVFVSDLRLLILHLLAGKINSLETVAVV